MRRITATGCGALTRLSMRRMLVPMLLVIGLSACDKRMAYGDADSIIIATSPALWAQIEDTTYALLEPPVRTVRNERTFQVTYQNPTDSLWITLRQFRQLLVVGSTSDHWVAEALKEARRDPEELNPPEIFQVRDVWAKSQLVTVAVLNDSNSAPESLGLMPEVHDLLDQQFREFVRARMFVSGPDTALASMLERDAGFTMMIPSVYRWSTMDSVYRFRNDNPSPSELIREVAVAWRTTPLEEITPELIAAWRDELIAEYYPNPQNTLLDNPEWRRLQLGADTIYQLQSSWVRPPESINPGGGPFISRVVGCSDQGRTYLLDAWLYAPAKDKYEFMIQLETILNSFRCTDL